MTRRRWYLGHEAVTLTVPVAGGEHRVSWRRGRLVLHDHDAAAEAVLRALGGETCPCLAIRDALRSSDLHGAPVGVLGRVTALRARGAAAAAPQAPPASPIAPSAPATRWPTPAGAPPPLPGPPDRRAVLLQSWRRWQADPAVQRIPPGQRTRIMGALRLQFAQAGMPESMLRILQAVDDVRRERRMRRTEAPPIEPSDAELLEARAAPALERAMRQALPYLRPHAPITVGVWKDVPGEPVLLQGDLTSRGGFVAVSLPARWLTRVWARGLACVDGQFVLDVDAPAPAAQLRARVLRWDKRLGGHWAPVAAVSSIERRAGRWHLDQ
jgi:hypothetical protein